MRSTTAKRSSMRVEPDVLSARFLAEPAAGHDANPSGLKQLKGIPAQASRGLSRTRHSRQPSRMHKAPTGAAHHVPGSFPAAWAAWMAAGGSLTEGNAYLRFKKH